MWPAIPQMCEDNDKTNKLPFQGQVLVTLLTCLKEDGVLWRLEYGIAFWIHDNDRHLKCRYAILFPKAGKSNLDN